MILAARIGDSKTLQNAYKQLKQREEFFPPGRDIFICMETIMQNYQDRTLIIDITDKWKNECIQKLKLQKWTTES